MDMTWFVPYKQDEALLQECVEIVARKLCASPVEAQQKIASVESSLVLMDSEEGRNRHNQGTTTTTRSPSGSSGSAPSLGGGSVHGILILRSCLITSTLYHLPPIAQ